MTTPYRDTPGLRVSHFEDPTNVRPEPVKAAAGAMAKMKAVDWIFIVNKMIRRMVDLCNEMRNDNGNQDWATAGYENDDVGPCVEWETL